MRFNNLVRNRSGLSRVTSALVLMLAASQTVAVADEFNYRVGRGIRDITGPAVGVQMWGFVREGQVTEGIHFRLWARAFVIADPDSGNRIAFVSADIGSITYAIQSEVVDRLQGEFGDTYTTENVLLSATHTHSGPGGYWHYGVGTPLGSPFLNEHFDAVVSGITAAIVDAHNDLQPGKILIGRAQVEGAGANRSMAAYLNNPADERARYNADTDREMTLLKFVDETGDIAALNWFAVHPTSMTYDNKLISGDHKGNASYRFEKSKGTDYSEGDNFVAAFAQSNCGDVTANLNLDNTGPGEDEFETTRIIAGRQLRVAQELFDSASEALSGPVDYRRSYISFPGLEVGDAFTGAGPQQTCGSAYGYSFAAGSTEDGGGNPLFHEGMTQRNTMVDNIVKEQFGIPAPSDEFRECHLPKAILLATGALDPPGQSQIVPVTLARVGQLVLVAVPAEFTTMAGRRLRETVQAALGDSVDYVVLAGYTNDYGGYVTTREEYDTQQYEGGHTLYGPWTLAAYQQEFTRLANSMRDGTRIEPGLVPRDMRGQVVATPLGGTIDALPGNGERGESLQAPKRSYRSGARVEVSFLSGHPQNSFRTGTTFLAVQRQTGDTWTTIATDNDWETRCRWTSDDESPDVLVFSVTWDIPDDAAAGVHRVVHFGTFRGESTDQAEPFKAVSKSFRVK